MLDEDNAILNIRVAAIPLEAPGIGNMGVGIAQEVHCDEGADADVIMGVTASTIAIMVRYIEENYNIDGANVDGRMVLTRIVDMAYELYEQGRDGQDD